MHNRIRAITLFPKQSRLIMFKKLILCSVFFLGLYSCQSDKKIISDVDSVAEDSLETNFENADTIPLFKSIPSQYGSKDIVLPEGFSYTILFQEKKDMVTRNDGKKFPAKGKHDLSVFIPDEEFPETKGQLYISHETKYADENLGDGGGGTVMDIELINGKWQITSEFYAIDFSPVGGTNRNCGGSITPNGTILTCEEAWAWNTPYLWQDGKGHRDTTWLNGRPIWQNMGYVVEVDPKTRKAIAKHWGMGKYVHEDAACTPDGKFVYLTDDNSPGIFYKYETKKAYDYSEGLLYAYKQSQDGESGEWIPMPMDTNSLVFASQTAVELGATMFVRHEWIEEVNGKYYISETGEDHFSFKESIKKGGSVPNYLDNHFKDGETGKYDDAFGRILVFDPKNNSMKPYLEGGFMEDSTGCFSNPDCNTSVTFGNKTYLVISEDINWYDRGRAGEWGATNKMFVNELYFLDMSIENPTVNDLMRFCIAPNGSETTGVIFLPDGSMIMNIQHPHASNGEPWNYSLTILIEGFKK